MADTPEILPGYLSFPQTTQDTPCPFCIHPRWMPLWKRLLHEGAGSFVDDVLVVRKSPPTDTPAAATHSPPVAILFVDESQTRPVSEILEAIANPKSSEVSPVIISRNEINAVVQGLKALLRTRNKVTKLPSGHQLSSTAQPALRRCRSLP